MMIPWGSEGEGDGMMIPWCSEGEGDGMRESKGDKEE